MTENIYFIFYVRPHPSGKVHRVNLGKFHLQDGQFEVLEDHGLPGDLAKKKPAEAAAIIARLTTSMYYEVVNMHDLLQGLHPELLRELKDSEPYGDMVMSIAETGHGLADSAADFEYERVGGEGPRTLSVSDGQVFLDGHLLSEAEIEKVQEQVKQGKAFLRKKMKKSEQMGVSEEKNHPHFTEDSLIPGVGNLAALKRFRAEQKGEGAFVHFNLHGLREINTGHGYPSGNLAVSSFGRGIRDSARQLAGGKAKVFRLGGDRFVAHVPSVESAALVARGVRSHLESVPPINGSHSMSASIGIGPTEDAAQSAMSQAEARRTRKLGQEKTHVAMSMPAGSESILS